MEQFKKGQYNYVEVRKDSPPLRKRFANGTKASISMVKRIPKKFYQFEA